MVLYEKDYSHFVVGGERVQGTNRAKTVHKNEWQQENNYNNPRFVYTGGIPSGFTSAKKAKVNHFKSQKIIDVANVITRGAALRPLGMRGAV